MDRFLNSIDIAQEDGVGNPSSGNTRVKAKTSGVLVARSSTGVENQLGGSLSVQSSVVASGTAGVSTLQPIPGLGSITIPPGKTATIYLLGRTAGAAVNTTSTQFGFRFSHGAGASSSLIGSAFGQNSATNAASDAHVKRGDTISVVAGASVDFTVTIANTSTVEVPAMAMAVVTNTSNNANSTVTGLFLVVSTTNVSGTSIFALIS